MQKPIGQKYETWGRDEILAAKAITLYWTNLIVNAGGCVLWETGDKNTIICRYKYGNGYGKTVTAEARPAEGDTYDEWIGKCVSLAKALRKDIPSFIEQKNAPIKIH